MSSKRRLRRRSCDGKARYDKEPAKAAAFNASRHTGQWIAEYKCKFCSGWHIGHPTKAARQALSAVKMER